MNELIINMSLLNLSILLLLCSTLSLAQKIAIHTDGSPADASALLDIKNTTKGILIPRMTQAQRNAILSPASRHIIGLIAMKVLLCRL